ncbi:MAG TPA: hypothetical protein H9775_04330 [Candidatus Blautia merdipullorum]|nr:hypothetical protein [Candidatus Blautia merdipullorum]
MKRRVLIFAAAAVAGMLLLTACTSKEEGAGQSAGTPTDAASGQTSSASSDVQQSSQTGQAADGQADASVPSQGEASGTPVDDSAAPEAAGEPVEDGGPVGEVIPDEYADAAENDTEGETQEAVSEAQSDAASEDIWSGTYASGTESVTLTYANEDSISFAFAQSGISGTAKVDGYQAVYNGDDHYVVVFSINGDVLDVSVSNEEDYDASGSPLIGTYVKE